MSTTTDIASLSFASSQFGDPLRSDASIKNSMVMIVDDEPINIKVVQKYLKDAGYHNLISTDDSTRAMGMIIGERPDLLLLDVMMPRVTGLDILESLRRETAFRETPVLILSAASDRETKLEARPIAPEKPRGLFHSVGTQGADPHSRIG